MGFDLKGLAAKVNTGFVNGMVKSKETSTETERKEMVVDSKGAWSLFLGKKD